MEIQTTAESQENSSLALPCRLIPNTIVKITPKELYRAIVRKKLPLSKLRFKYKIPAGKIGRKKLISVLRSCDGNSLPHEQAEKAIQILSENTRKKTPKDDHNDYFSSLYDEELGLLKRSIDNQIVVNELSKICLQQGNSVQKLISSLSDETKSMIQEFLKTLTTEVATNYANEHPKLEPEISQAVFSLVNNVVAKIFQDSELPPESIQKHEEPKPKKRKAGQETLEELIQQHENHHQEGLKSKLQAIEKKLLRELEQHDCNIEKETLSLLKDRVASLKLYKSIESILAAK